MTAFSVARRFLKPLNPEFGMNANVLKTSGSGYVRASPNKSNGNRSGWWDRPLVFLLMLLLAAVVCGMPLLVAGGYAVAVFTTMRGWLTEGTLGVHIVLWTLAAMVGFVVADRLAMIPHNPVGWPAWWILLTVAAHLIYLAKLTGPISRFIRNS